MNISNINLDKGGIITCSVDKRVRIWSNNLDLWGTLDQRTEIRDKKWCFPLEYKNERKGEEIEKVKSLLDDIQIDDDHNKNIIYRDEIVNNEGFSK